MSDKPFEPVGTPFYDKASKRQMKYVTKGPHKGWLVYKHPDGDWVTFRKATDEDCIAIAESMSFTHHVLLEAGESE